MFTKTSVSSTSSPAIAGSGFQSRAVDERRARETHSSRVWREERAEMLEALDSFKERFTPTTEATAAAAPAAEAKKSGDAAPAPAAAH